MKTIWMTSLIPLSDQVKNLISSLKTYGLEVRGHTWEDNLDKMTWVGPRDELIKSEVSMWLILASTDNFATPSIRYGLALLAMTVQARRGASFPMAVLLTGKEKPSPEILPTPLKGADLLSLLEPGMSAKLVARVHTPGKEIKTEYRMDVYGNPQIGQWFEVGPSNTNWPGVMFGASGGEITFHAVGPKGALPSKSVLNYPLKGLKLSLGGKEYNAWAAQNELDPQSSYFIQVKGYPDSILFGPYSTQEDADVYVVRIK